jgi:ketosteroid isomerase-like protein
LQHRSGKTEALAEQEKTAMTRRLQARLIYLAVAIIAGAVSVAAQNSSMAATAAAAFSPLQQWKSAVSNRDAAALASLYSTDPPAHIVTKGGDADTEADVAFWTGLRTQGLKFEVLQFTAPQPSLQQIVFQAQFDSPSTFGGRTAYVAVAQVWLQRNGKWELVAAQRGNPAQLEQPVSVTNQIYPEVGDPRVEIQRALAEAAKSHKRLIVIFGANWCYDCHVLDLAFHRPDIAPILQRSFEVVHVDVGHGDKNQDLMTQYGVPIQRGIPALAVLASDGRLLFSQTNGQFENARALSPEDLLRFLRKWSPQAQ